MRRPKLSRPEQHAAALHSKGPYTAHQAITHSFVEGPEEGSGDFHQTTSTILGAHRLAELLNHAYKVASEYRSDILGQPLASITVEEIVAAAVARSLGWRLELPHDRKARLDRTGWPTRAAS